LLPLGLTLSMLAWAVAWAVCHVRIRRARRYAQEREHVAGMRGYKALSMSLFAMQCILSVWCFWSDRPFLLELHNSAALRIGGFVVMGAATWLYFAALAHLGESYSPCYDSHLPQALVTTGPYRLVRHPMYAAKLLIGAGTVLVCGSAWLLPPLVCLVYATLAATAAEDRLLAERLPGYAPYRARTAWMIPRVF
jgi:protein-S-isoprenylcysteine O-methyltransferase Ste14